MVRTFQCNVRGALTAAGDAGLIANTLQPIETSLGSGRCRSFFAHAAMHATYIARILRGYADASNSGAFYRYQRELVSASREQPDRADFSACNPDRRG
jgi:hypothetical protein